LELLGSGSTVLKLRDEIADALVGSVVEEGSVSELVHRLTLHCEDKQVSQQDSKGGEGERTEMDTLVVDQHGPERTGDRVLHVLQRHAFTSSVPGDG
jgi:hypothetical protein